MEDSLWQGGMDLPRSVMRVRLRLSLVSWLQPTRPLRTTESPTRVQANPNTWGRHISDGCLIDFNRRIRNLFPPTRGSSGRSYLEVGQAGDECGDAPAGDGRAVQTQLLRPRRGARPASVSPVLLRDSFFRLQGGTAEGYAVVNVEHRSALI